MASISTYKGKGGDTLRAIQFVGSDKKRRSIRLGTLNSAGVVDVKRRVSLLEAYRKGGQQPEPDTVLWLSRLNEGIYDTLAAGGLVPARIDKQKGLTLGAWLESYLGQRQALVTAGQIVKVTHDKERYVRICLLDRFDANKQLADF